MGMSASQARFLTITARLSNVEMTQQMLAFSKQRLADSSAQANDRYLDALNKTKYQVITGYNNASGVYEDLSYNQLVGLNSIAMGKQYLVKDNNGKVLVSNKIAEAFKLGNGDYNKFLTALGVTQSNIDITKPEDVINETIHEAWDKYLVSIGKGKENEEHNLQFGYVQMNNNAFEGYPTYNSPNGNNNYTPLLYEGSNNTQRELYDYAVAITEAFYNPNSTSKDLKYDTEIVNYYKNIFNEIRNNGFTTLNSSEEVNFKDTDWFVNQLKSGKLNLYYYSAAESQFLNTSLSEDESICEKEDSSAIALAEAEYNGQMDQIEKQDKQLDLQMNRLESEHTALQQEYDAVKGVIKNNVEKTFNIFGNA